ncbi:hypothetical protein [Nitrospirillum amazonense]|uniref:hypothetical protein n=1 Tax=Nitrospirillum amazonense TaxID=28077 RepID=UPI0024125F74|nr:hypothetical protein [Nitrospirillum amazonense]MDG3443241.1 hypothetical protein [Nitrospirillum amazonense]
MKRRLGLFLSFMLLATCPAPVGAQSPKPAPGHLVVFSELSGAKIKLARQLLSINTPAGADDFGHIADPKKIVRYAEVDLNGDGIPEILLAVADAYYCGTSGCTVFVYQKQDDIWTFLTPLWTDAGDLVVLDRTDNGYRRFIHVYIDSNADRPDEGGDYPRHYEMMSWTGKAYRYEPLTVEAFTRLSSPSGNN